MRPCQTAMGAEEDRPLFEDILEEWKKRDTEWAASWKSDDPRHDLAAEVRERLEQLDILLDHLAIALERVLGSPESQQEERARIMELQRQLAEGAITQEEFFSRLPLMCKSRDQLLETVRAWGEVRLFTETFYLVSWRLSSKFSDRKPRNMPFQTLPV